MVLSPKRQRVKTKTLKVQILPEHLFCSQLLTGLTGSGSCCFTVSWSQLGRVLRERWVLSVDGSDEMFLPLVSLLLLLLGEVLSGLAVFGGLVGRRGLGGVCTRGQGVGDGHTTGHHALQCPWNTAWSHSNYTRRVSGGRREVSVTVERLTSSRSLKP